MLASETVDRNKVAVILQALSLSDQTKNSGYLGQSGVEKKSEGAS